jgi:hypothetical protein
VSVVAILCCWRGKLNVLTLATGSFSSATGSVEEQKRGCGAMPLPQVRDFLSTSSISSVVVLILLIRSPVGGSHVKFWVHTCLWKC